MRCRIAELLVDVPEAGGLAPRCRDYLTSDINGADITIRAENYRHDWYPAGTSPEDVAYMESGRQFCTQLLDFGGIYLHASAVLLDGRVYLFSGDPGAGKSTHSRLWQQVFGAKAVVINDDKPALRQKDGQWYAYGTPWCGKDGINQNLHGKVAGICFLKKAKENSIRQLSSGEAVAKIYRQTLHWFSDITKMDTVLTRLDSLLRQIPVFELENLPTAEAVRMSYEAMRPDTEEKR